MKVLAICAMWMAVASAGLLHSPLAVRAFLPATRGYSYSTYLNTAPASYSFTVHPQLGYQLPHALAPYQSYYPYFPPAAVYYPPPAPILGSPSYPSLPSLPSHLAPAPGYPAPTPGNPAPAPPQQPAGDADTAVVDASPQQGYQPDRQEPQQFPQSGPGEQSPGSNGQPANTFPSFPQFPQQLPNFPQFPQGQPSLPSFPQFPQQPGQPSFPQFPQQPADQPSFPQQPADQPSFPQQPADQPSFPQQPADQPLFPQQPADQPSFPQQPSDQFSQFPSSTPSSFPAPGSSDQGLNDEDTISVESA